MKNEAFEAGKREALKYQKQIIAVSEQFYRETAQEYAHGHFSTSKAQANFVDGWMSAPQPLFVDGEHVNLEVRIMNTRFASVLEKKMYEVFSIHPANKITFLSESKICLKYRLQSPITLLNRIRASEFLRDRYVNYKLVVE